MDAPCTPEVFEFGPFHLDRRGGGLFRRDGDVDFAMVPLGSRALDLLLFLVEHQGDLLSKHEIMAAVWPNTVVEDANLSVQISALRRALDRDRAFGSCIETVPGRGYRFVAPVRRSHPDASDSVAPADVHGDSPDFDDADTLVSRRDQRPGAHGTTWRRRPLLSAIILCVIVLASAAGLLSVTTGAGWWSARGSVPPRLSLVLLPFDNLSGDSGDDHLADGVTDDLTSELSQITDASVVARDTAYSFKAKAVDVRQIGKALNVRYAIEGSVRRIESVLRVNVHLISAETGTQLWADRFDVPNAERAAVQEQIVARLYDELAATVVDTENARGMRERPNDPDALDLLLRARSLQHLPQSNDRDEKVLALYEQALQRDPSSVMAMASIAYFLTDRRPGGVWGTFEDMRRADDLLARAQTLAPDSWFVLNNRLYWLRTVGRCQEVIDAARRAIQSDPNRVKMWTGVYTELGVCETWMGHAEEEIALQQRVIQLYPRTPWLFVRYRHMAYAALMLGRDLEAIDWLRQSLVMKPDLDVATTWVFRMLAAAYARTGQLDEAHHYLAEADRLWPYDTVRSHIAEDASSPVYVEQVGRFREALRLAGERDHADEDADFGVPSDAILHSERAGPTPKDAPGVRTIRTPDLARLLADADPLVITTFVVGRPRSIPGSIGLRFAGLGGSFTDSAQDRLRAKMRELAGDDHDRPVVAVGLNSERFEGRNLALRLLALGYTHVFWYRGGREAWEVANIPETDLAVREW